MSSPYPELELWPSELPSCRLQGSIFAVTGQSDDVSVSVWPNTRVIVTASKRVILIDRNDPINVPVNPNTGEIRFNIPANDNPALSPVGWKYYVQITYRERNFYTVIHNAPTGGVVEVADLVVVPAAPEIEHDLTGEYIQSLILLKLLDTLEPGPGIEIVRDGSKIKIIGTGGGTTPVQTTAFPVRFPIRLA